MGKIKKINYMMNFFIIFFTLIIFGCADRRIVYSRIDLNEINISSSFDAQKRLLDLMSQKSNYIKKLNENFLKVYYSRNSDFIIFIGNEKTGFFTGNRYNVLEISKIWDRPISIELIHNQLFTNSTGELREESYTVVLHNIEVCYGILRRKPKVTDTDFDLTFDEHNGPNCRNSFGFKKKDDGMKFSEAIISLFPHITKIN